MIADRDFTTMNDFIGGRLSDDECREFEQRLVRDPTLVRELEESLRMRAGLQQLRARGYIHGSSSVDRSFRNWTPAACAAAAILVLALFLWLPRVAGPGSVLLASPPTPTAGNAAARIAAHFTFVSVRGSSVPDLEAPSAGLIEIRAAPSSPHKAARYRMALVKWDDNGSPRTIASLTDLAVGTDGYVHSYADAGRLTAGNYVLRIQSDNDTPATADVFPFSLNTRSPGSSR